MIYVNRMDRESRRASIEKMKRVLNAGNSVMEIRGAEPEMLVI